MPQRLPRRPRGDHRNLEFLEDRCLLSASHRAWAPGLASNTIVLSQAPAVVQSGLDALATTDSLALPADSQTVILGNKNGVETYTIDILANGIDNKLTVDVKGNPVTAPTKATTTFGAVTNTAVTDELTAIASALTLTAPAATDSVTVITASDGTQTFSYGFTNSSGRGSRGVTLDASGNPVGNAVLPLSIFSSKISAALVNAAPSGATALTATSPVTVKTLNGITTYSATYLSIGMRTTVTVDATGTLTNLPSTSVAPFSTIPALAQATLESLAAAKGFTGTIADTQNVNIYDEANGTVIYTVRLPVSKTGTGGGTYTYSISVASDQSGNPTVPPTVNGRGGDGCGGGGPFNGTGGPVASSGSGLSFGRFGGFRF